MNTVTGDLDRSGSLLGTILMQPPVETFVLQMSCSFASLHSSVQSVDLLPNIVVDSSERRECYTPMASAEQATYPIKRITLFDRTLPIFIQNANGPCPLLAIANTLSLRNQLETSAQQVLPGSASISQSRLISLVAERILDAGDGGASEANIRQTVADCLEVLSKLTTGIDVNVSFHSVTGFEPTRDTAVFDILGIQLVHGWLVDPQDKETAEVLGQRSYNELVELMVSSLDDSAISALGSAGGGESFRQAVSRSHSRSTSSKGLTPSGSLTRAQAATVQAATAQLLGSSSTGSGGGAPVAEAGAESSAVVASVAPRETEHGRQSSVQEVSTPAATQALTQQAPSNDVSTTIALPSTHHNLPAHDAPLISLDEGSINSGHAAASLVDPFAALDPFDILPAASTAPATTSSGPAAAAVTQPAASSHLPGNSCPDGGHAVHGISNAAAEPSTTPSEAQTTGGAALTVPAGFDSTASSSTPAAVSAEVTARTEVECLASGTGSASRMSPVVEATAESTAEAVVPVSGEHPPLDEMPDVASSTATPLQLAGGAPAPSTGAADAAAVAQFAKRAYEALVVKDFMEGTCSQLTVYGLSKLLETARPNQTLVFFRNNHFNTMFRHERSLFLLVTDQGYLNEPGVVWERLDQIDGDTIMCGPTFAPYTPPPRTQPASPVALQQTAYVTPGTEGMSAEDAAAVTAASGPTPSVDADADLAMALHLQEQEEAEAAQRRRQQQQAQQQQQQQHGQQQQAYGHPSATGHSQSPSPPYQQAGRGRGAVPLRSPAQAQGQRQGMQGSPGAGRGTVPKNDKDTSCLLM